MQTVEKTAPNKKLLIILLIVFIVVSSAAAVLRDDASLGHLLRTVVTIYLLGACAWVGMRQLEVPMSRVPVIGFFVALAFCLLFMEVAPWQVVETWFDFARNIIGGFILVSIYYVLLVAGTGACIVVVLGAATGRAPVVTRASFARLSLLGLLVAGVVSIITLVIPYIYDASVFLQENLGVLFFAAELLFSVCFAPFYYYVVMSYFGETRTVTIRGCDDQPGDGSLSGPTLKLSPLVLMIPVLLLYLAPGLVNSSALLRMGLDYSPLLLLVLQYVLLVAGSALVGLIGVRKENVWLFTFVCALLGVGLLVAALQLIVPGLFYPLAELLGLPILAFVLTPLTECALLIVPLALLIGAYTNKDYKELPVSRLANKNGLLIGACAAYVAVCVASSLSSNYAFLESGASPIEVAMAIFDRGSPLYQAISVWANPLFWLVALATVWRFGQRGRG